MGVRRLRARIALSAAGGAVAALAAALALGHSPGLASVAVGLTVAAGVGLLARRVLTRRLSESGPAARTGPPDSGGEPAGQGGTLDRMAALLEATAAVSTALARGLPPETIEQEVVERTRTILGARTTAVYKLHAESGEMVVAASAGGHDHDEWIPAVPAGMGVVGAVMKGRGTLATPDALADPCISYPAARRTELEQSAIRALLGVPLQGTAGILGVLAVRDVTGREFTPEDVRLVEHLAGQAGLVLERARLWQRLAESEARFRAHVEASDVGIYLHQDGLIRLANRTLARMHGYDRPEELVGRPYAILLAPEDRERVEGYRTARLRGEPAPVVYEIENLKKDGTRIWVRNSIALVPWEGRLAVVVSCVDVSERTHAEMEAARQRRQTEALAGLARHLTQTLDAAQVSERVCTAALDLLGGCVAVVRTLGPDGSFHTVGAAGAAREHSPPGQSVPPEGSLMSAVRDEGRPLWSRNILEDPRLRLESLRQQNTAGGIKALLVAPLRVHGKVIGVLTVGDPRERDFAPDEVAFAQAIADEAAVALENALLYEEAETRQRRAETFATIARALNQSLDHGTVLERVAEAARTVTASDMGRVALRDGERDRITFRHWSGARWDDYASIAIERGRGMGGLVWATGRPMRTANRETDPAISKDYMELVRGEGTVTALVVPILLDGTVEGLICVNNRSPREFTDRDEEALVQLADHAATALRNSRLLAAAEASRLHAEALSHRLVSAQETERRALARELHDEIGQALTAAKISLEMARRRASPSGADRLADSLSLVDGVLQNVRDLTLALRPAILDDLGLEAAVRWYVTTHAERAGLTSELNVTRLSAAPSSTVATACFRIAQGAVSNVLRHASARRLGVELRERAGRLELTIRDDGRGFDVPASCKSALRGESLGILVMEERAQLAGGSLEITSGPGQGTVVTARFPLEDAAGPAERAAS